MTQFQLKQVSANDSLIKFHVNNQSDGSICGSINVEPSEESDLLQHWRSAPPAAAFENDLGMETLSIGRGALSGEDSVLEIAGRWLCYRVALRGAEARLAACLMDAAAAPETLLRAPDTAAGWKTVHDVVRALEVHKIKSLERPIEAWDGFDGANCFVIG